jgi:hypothetical protein
VRLRTKKRLINACSLALLSGGVVALTWVWRSPPPEIVLPETRVTATQTAARPSLASPAEADLASWRLTLRRPLYDPPPPPPQQVVVQQRPITIQLMGTVIEADNSQAFVRQASGAVELKRLGDQVTGDPADGVIGQITATEIVIRREDGEHHLAVQRSN